MSLNPYAPPNSATEPESVGVLPSRSNLAGTIESFLAGDLSAFEFDDRLDAFRESDDPVIQVVTTAVWYYYDDCDDHLVSLSKPEWDYFQRLLLLLASDCKVDTQTRRVWSLRQLVAAVSLILFIYFAAETGWGRHLLVLAIPFGVISMLLCYVDREPRTQVDPYQPIICPFATLSDLEVAYRSSQFRKTRYPKEIAGRSIRSPFMDGFHQLYAHIVWLLLSPIPLLLQSFPETETQSLARAT